MHMTIQEGKSVCERVKLNDTTPCSKKVGFENRSLPRLGVFKNSTSIDVHMLSIAFFFNGKVNQINIWRALMWGPPKLAGAHWGSGPAHYLHPIWLVNGWQLCFLAKFFHVYKFNINSNGYVLFMCTGFCKWSISELGYREQDQSPHRRCQSIPFLVLSQRVSRYTKFSLILTFSWSSISAKSHFNAN